MTDSYAWHCSFEFTDLKENGMVSALPKIVVTSFKMVHLQYFFTAGV